MFTICYSHISLYRYKSIRVYFHFKRTRTTEAVHAFAYIEHKIMIKHILINYTNLSSLFVCVKVHAHKLYYAHIINIQRFIFSFTYIVYLSTSSLSYINMQNLNILQSTHHTHIHKLNIFHFTSLFYVREGISESWKIHEYICICKPTQLIIYASYYMFLGSHNHNVRTTKVIYVIW